MATNGGTIQSDCLCIFAIYAQLWFNFGSTGQIVVPFWFQQPGRAAAGWAAGTKMEPKFGQWSQTGTEMEHTESDQTMYYTGNLVKLSPHRFPSKYNGMILV